MQTESAKRRVIPISKYEQKLWNDIIFEYDFHFWYYIFQIHPIDNFDVHVNIKVDATDLYDQYYRLIFAKIACGNDKQCIGIYDASCDQQGPFLLLKRGFITVYSSLNCIHKKKTYDGKQIVLQWES